MTQLLPSRAFSRTWASSHTVVPAPISALSSTCAVGMMRLFTFGLLGLSDDRRAAQAGHAPDRTPGDRAARAGRLAPALAEAAEPGAQRGEPAFARHGHADPHGEVHQRDRPGQVAAGQPHPVARV